MVNAKYCSWLWMLEQNKYLPTIEAALPVAAAIITLGLLGLPPDLVKIFSAQHDIASINLDFPTPDKDKLILKGEMEES